MENELKVQDIYLAAFVYSTHRVKLERTEDETLPDGKTKTFFYFSPKEIAQGLVDAYFTKSAEPVQPRDLFSALRDIKDIIFGKKRLEVNHNGR